MPGIAEVVERMRLSRVYLHLFLAPHLYSFLFVLLHRRGIYGDYNIFVNQDVRLRPISVVKIFS